MKKYMTIFLNWRVNVLLLIGMVALFLIAGDTDNTIAFLWSKALGIALAYACYRLGKYWNGKGKINDLMALADEE